MTKEGFLHSLFGDDSHVKRMVSLVNTTLGVMTMTSLATRIADQMPAQVHGSGNRNREPGK